MSLNIRTPRLQAEPEPEALSSCSVCIQEVTAVGVIQGFSSSRTSLQSLRRIFPDLLNTRPMPNCAALNLG